MPNPIPRNRSAGGRQPRRPVRQQAWQILAFQRPRENVRQPESPPPPPPPPPQPRPRARHRARPDLPFRRPQENIGQPRTPPTQPRRPARHRATPGLPFRRPQENIGQPGAPLPPTPTRSGTSVAVGVIICAVAALVVWIVAPLFPSGTSAGSTAFPPMNDHAAAAAGDNPPGAVGGELATPPGTLVNLDRGPTPEGGAPDTGANPAVGLPVAPVAKSQPVPATQPARPGEPANVADPGQRVDPPVVDQVQRRPVHKPGHAEQTPPRQPPTPPPSQPHAPSDAEAAQLRERLASLARKLAQHQQDSAPKVVRPPTKAAPPRQTSKKQSGTGGSKNVNRPSDSKGSSTSGSGSASSTSGSGSGSSGSGSSNSGSGSGSSG